MPMKSILPFLSILALTTVFACVSRADPEKPKTIPQGYVQLPNGRWVPPTDPRAKKGSDVDPDSEEARKAKFIEQGYVQLPNGTWVPATDPRVKKGSNVDPDSEEARKAKFIEKGYVQ